MPVKRLGAEILVPIINTLCWLHLPGVQIWDVVSLLTKMKVGLDNFDVKVEGKQSDEQPVHYIRMHITYEFWAKELPNDQLEKAINLSLERYCGVYAVYKEIMPITYSIVTHLTDK
jgi:putative redox protein